MLDGPLDEIREAHRRSTIRFGDPLTSPPAIDGALQVVGEGRAWTAIHNTSPEAFNQSVIALGGEIMQSRESTLQEIFVARVGRGHHTGEAE